MELIQTLIEFVEAAKKTYAEDKDPHFCETVDGNNVFKDICKNSGVTCFKCPFNQENTEEALKLLKSLQPYAKTLQLIDPGE